MKINMFDFFMFSLFSAISAWSIVEYVQERETFCLFLGILMALIAVGCIIDAAVGVIVAAINKEEE